MPTNLGKQQVYSCDSVAPTIDYDGTTIGLECSLTGVTEKLYLGLTPEKAKELHFQLGLIISTSLKDPTVSGGAGFVRMTNVVEAGANATDPNHVLLYLKTDAGSAHYFALAPETSARLRPKLRSAEAEASRGVRLPRA